MRKLEALSVSAITRRSRWVKEIARISGKFDRDTSRIKNALASELKREGVAALTDHIRLCGAIPEHYGHDSSEEKLYSKYTDILLAEAFRHIGLTSIVLEERADAADVEATCKYYSLVADAKAFRLSRTAKNQKDFKIEAMDGWKRGKPHAVVVCPIYQLPARTSQIYQQAIARNVCILSYSHIAALVRFYDESNVGPTQRLLLAIMKSAEELNPTKDANAYWTCINRAMLGYHKTIRELWRTEKLAMLEGLAVAKEEALEFLASEREQIMKMSRQEAITRLIRDRNLDGREKMVRSVRDNGLLSIT